MAVTILDRRTVGGDAGAVGDGVTSEVLLSMSELEDDPLGSDVRSSAITISLLSRREYDALSPPADPRGTADRFSEESRMIEANTGTYAQFSSYSSWSSPVASRDTFRMSWKNESAAARVSKMVVWWRLIASSIRFHCAAHAPHEIIFPNDLDHFHTRRRCFGVMASAGQYCLTTPRKWGHIASLGHSGSVQGIMVDPVK